MAIILHTHLSILSHSAQNLINVGQYQDVACAKAFTEFDIFKSVKVINL